MCGYIERELSRTRLRHLLNEIQMPMLFDEFPVEEGMQRFRPAFGGAVNNKIKGLIIEHQGKLKCVDATWWYGAKMVGDQLVLKKSYTFNARELDKEYWISGIRQHRAIVIATGVGEAKKVDGKDHRFLAIGEQPLLLGAVYAHFPNGQFTTAVITRNEHPRFKKYHEDAFPLFLPPDPEKLRHWLDSSETEFSPVISDLLDHQRVYTGMYVTPVKTYLRGEPLGETEYFPPD